ncbi:hypothetical protein IQ215_06245 [Cyanobacterium stanieri LEGE 03274]|uniref:Chromosome segregation ATPase n=1 Tax=Cyanobacterium stanieri LEGE 03274 TaxID=1828756 RepID=A0ABR9V341_9CHRO|nr:hypothetical protein [Cyanobacterium stanieri]MBE9222293.1 hypothetical protein [Cyanobacterium stanieri LEGE 03274]
MDNLSDKNITFESDNDNQKYKSKNFSVGIISLIIGILFTISGALAYYFTRPCVLGECTLIPQSQENVEDYLSIINPEMDSTDLTELQLNLIAINLQLNNIPSWSDYHEQAQNLITENQITIDDLDKILEALTLVENAQSMSNQLPLSTDEWQRIESFWLEAIALIQSVENQFLQPWIDNKIAEYNNILSSLENSIEQEKKANQLLSEAQQLAQENDQLKNETSSLTQLKNIENNWLEAIDKIREIPPLTSAQTDKENLLEKYNQNLSQIRATIRQEEIAENLYGQIQNKIIQAENAEKNNQWTNAVNHWQEVNNLITQFPDGTFKQQPLERIRQTVNQKLPQAQEELKQAINRQNAREELARICQGSSKICDYQVENNLIKVTLTTDYLMNIARITQQSANTNNSETEILINHINQVEQNYRYLSFKYKMPLEVYNPQQKLIVKYN